MLPFVAGVAVGAGAFKLGKKLFGRKKKKHRAPPPQQQPPQDPRIGQVLQNQAMLGCMMRQVITNQQALLANQGAILGNQGAIQAQQGAILANQGTIMQQNAFNASVGCAVLGNVAALNAMYSPCGCPGAFLATMDRMFGMMPPLPC